MKRTKCNFCAYLNYDFINDRYDDRQDFVCGLHGSAQVNPNGPQMDLDHKGGCGFSPKYKGEQLTLDFK